MLISRSHPTITSNRKKVVWSKAKLAKKFAGDDLKEERDQKCFPYLQLNLVTRESLNLLHFCRNAAIGVMGGTTPSIVNMSLQISI